MNNKQNNKQRRILAFDFGTKRMGVAFGQELTKTVIVLEALSMRDGIPNWDHLKTIIDEWHPDAFVVGSPINMDGSKSEMAIRAKKFCNRLNGRFHKPSFNMDERLSTFEARTQLMELEPDLKRKVSLDSMAAKLILESWFRSQEEA